MQDAINSLVNAGYNTGKVLRDNINIPLHEYLTKSLSTLPKIDIEDKYFRLVKKTLQEDLVSQGRYKPQEVNAILYHLAIAPVVQRVDHGELFLNPGTFMNNYLYQISAEKNNLPFLLTKQCTRVKCLTNRTALSGAAFLHFSDSVYKIFDASKGLLNLASIATLQDTTVIFKKQRGTKQNFVPELLMSFLNKKYKTASAAVMDINYSIWNQLNIPNKKRLILINEDFSANLMRNYLMEKNVIYQTFSDPKKVSLLLSEYTEYAKKHPETLLHKTTEFFWYKDGKELKSLEYDSKLNKFLMSEKGGKRPVLDCDITSLSNALANKTVYPDIFLSYLLLNVLPSFKALGGTSQHEYLPAICKIFLNYDSKTHLLDGKKKQEIESMKRSVLNFSSLMDITGTVAQDLEQLSSTFNFQAFNQKILNKPISALIGDLSKVSYMISQKQKVSSQTIHINSQYVRS